MVYQILCKRIKWPGGEPLVHALFWVLYILGEIYSLSILTGRFSTLEHYVFYYLLNMLLFYGYLWLLYRIPNRPHAEWLYWVSIFLLVMTIYVLLAAVLSKVLGGVSNQGHRIWALDKKFYVSTIWRGIYFMLFATGYFLIKRNARQREVRMEKEIEVERLRNRLMVTEKNFLRSQINPHLLFNTINFIQHAIKHDPANASVALGGLSDIMDYALENAKKDFVSLEEETAQIENMIRLNRLRFGEKLGLDFLKDIEAPGMQIIPIILLTIVENVFKHAHLTDRNHPVRIELIGKADHLIFRTLNLPSNNSLSRGERTGLENIRQRLAGSYPSKHRFESGLKDNLFFTELHIYTK